MSKINGEEGWFLLEHVSAAGSSKTQITMNRWPFRIGRCSSCNYVVKSPDISKQHAEFDLQAGGLFVRDLGSTNGTFVNGKRVAEHRLKPDDVIHLAKQEFIWHTHGDPSAFDSRSFHTKPNSGAPMSISNSRRNLQELVRGKAARIVFQPIVDLATHSSRAYEALARSTHDSLNMPPCELFGLAEQCGLAPELSGMFRQLAMADAALLPASCLLFLNLHPFEVTADGFARQLLAALSDCSLKQQAVLEINEKAIISRSIMRRLHDQTREYGIKIAYDDFGAGQARLFELSEFRPDFVKLDMSLVRHIDHSSSRRSLVQSLVRTCRDLGVQTVAEGLETEQEVDLCRSFGCEWGQGYYFGRPEPAAHYCAIENGAASTVECKLMV
ncbi:MAG TPA: EAL domain-containing protein [Gemmataceae bacterium]|nr:EAL domain-containing protein [Gemmataceae bacterium]